MVFLFNVQLLVPSFLNTITYYLLFLSQILDNGDMGRKIVRVKGTFVKLSFKRYESSSSGCHGLGRHQNA